MGPRPLGRGRLLWRIIRRGLRQASMGPRPLGRGRVYANRPNAIVVMLQWGRDLSAAEGLEMRACAEDVRLASMGPRPLGRGRNVKVADEDPFTSRFNGAATSRPRKDFAALAGVGRRIASMGPRPLGRGRHCGNYHSCRPLNASMGPRPLGRGRLKICRRQRQVSFASMGPRPLGRGRPCASW